MHASIVLFVMMVGGPVVPEPEIVVVPLRDDISNPSFIQEMEFRERAKAHPLPPVPTIDATQQARDDGQTPRMPLPPTDVRAPRPSQPMMPQAPTSPDAPRGPMANMPYQPGGGTAPPSQFGGGSPTAAAPRNDPYANASPAGRNPVYGYSGIPTPAALPSQTASNYASNYTNSIAQTQARYGLSPTAPTMTADPSGATSRLAAINRRPATVRGMACKRQPTTVRSIPIRIMCNR